MMDVDPAVGSSSDYERPPSEQLVELHLYLVPKEKWLEKRKLAKNQAVDHTISVGFVRVLPQTVLSELRKEMNRQLGLESVPQSFVFLRSVGRNFTQVRPKQEMEMKVKNYMPPYAPEPELYLKEGQYTGTNNWSQGEDSGLEESLGDSNSQRSHDRATPESLTDDALVLPKLTDFLGVPDRPDLDDRASMPPGAMTISMSADDLSSHGLEGPFLARKGPVKASHRYSTEDVRPPPIHERTEEYHQRLRASSWNRRQRRSPSKERGGTQLSTWSETRTTRLRRSRALGETNGAGQPQKQQPKKAAAGKEKRSDSKVRPGRVHPGDRVEDPSTVRARKRSVTDTGMGLKDKLAILRLKKKDPPAPPPGTNGVYATHARKSLKGDEPPEAAAEEAPPPAEKEEKKEEEGKATIESTSIKLLDDRGKEVEVETPKPEKRDDATPEAKREDARPEVVRHHTLAVDGVDARKAPDDAAEKPKEKPTPTKPVAKEKPVPKEKPLPKEKPPPKEKPKEEVRPAKLLQVPKMDDGAPEPAPSPREPARKPDRPPEPPPSRAEPSRDLQEGQLTSRNGDLTIEVEVKELDDQPIEVGQWRLEADSGEFNSYRVYSEQNLQPVGDDGGVRRPTRREMAAARDPPRRARAGVYGRRAAASLPRTRSDELQRSPTRRRITRIKKEAEEKWSTTAASTGDLREIPWDFESDKERLMVMLQEVRNETRARQRQRETLLRQIKQLQQRAHQRREQVREMWRKRYLEAKKITPRLEEECSRLRQELEKLHRELLAKVQAGVWALLTISGKTERPSNKLSYKIMIARLLQEIEDLTRRVEGTRLKLHTEVKLRSMAEKDVRNLREELLKKKIQVTLTRNQEQAALGNGLRQQYFISAV